MARVSPGRGAPGAQVQAGVAQRKPAQDRMAAITPTHELSADGLPGLDVESLAFFGDPPAPLFLGVPGA